MIILNNQDAIRWRQERLKQEKDLEMNANAGVKEKEDKQKEQRDEIGGLSNRLILHCSVEAKRWF